MSKFNSNNGPSTPISPGEEYYRSFFNEADKDGNGTLDMIELQEMLHRANSYDSDRDVPPIVVERILEMSDQNKDGGIDFNEFVPMLHNPVLDPFFGKYVKRYVKFIVPKKKLRSNGSSIDSPDGLYEDEYTCWPPKVGMIIISIMELTFFLIDELSVENSTRYATGPMAKIFIYDPNKRHEVWRFVTYMFVHIGHLHLVVNLVVQIFIGLPLEMVHGWWRILVIYFTGVVAGSLATSITDPTAKLAGASGGVYSLITAHIASIIMNWGEMSFPAVQLAIFLLITVMDVGTSIYNRYVKNVNDHVGYAAHLAGAIAGLLVGINVLRNLKVTKKEKVIWWVSIILYAILMVIAIFWKMFFEDYFTQITT